MKKILIGFGLAVSSVALAYSPMSGLDDLDLNVDSLMQDGVSPEAQEEFRGGPDHGDHHGRRDHHRGNRKMECGKIAWRHTKPTQAQNDSAKALLKTAFQAVHNGMPAVKAAFGELKKATEKHPISKAEVNSAVEGIKRVGEPLRQGVQDAFIDVINLLSPSQRVTFNEVKAACMKHGHHHHHP